MRRVISSLLLALFSFPLIAQAFALNPAPSLPACCRRAGAHHCAMPGPDTHSHSGPQLALSRCSQFPQSSIVSAIRSFRGATQRPARSSHPNAIPCRAAVHRLYAR